MRARLKEVADGPGEAWVAPTAGMRQAARMPGRLHMSNGSLSFRACCHGGWQVLLPLSLLHPCNS